MDDYLNAEELWEEAWDAYSDVYHFMTTVIVEPHYGEMLVERIAQNMYNQLNKRNEIKIHKYCMDAVNKEISEIIKEEHMEVVDYSSPW